ncbi:MAG TPA: hypothetical protein VJ825_11065 [Gemmatimonadaceae bacterium]|nr:hypothetical protein [Gemmatimonadaceae bacterium]
MPPIAARRKGFVLAAALLALLMIAALVAGVVFAANEGTRMAVASADRQLTLAAAESSIEEAMLADDASEWMGAMGATTTSSQEASAMPVTIYRTRLDTTLFWIVADAGPARAGSGVMSRVGVLVRVNLVAGTVASIDRISDRWWSELF